MKVEIISCLQDNYSYLIIDESNNLACIVDPSEASPVIDYLKNKSINLKYILNTHHHFDHIGGNKELKKKYNSIVVGFKHDSERIPEIDICLEDNEIWKSDNFIAKIIHVPGHTKGHICFHFYKDKNCVLKKIMMRQKLLDNKETLGRKEARLIRAEIL